MVKFNKLNVTYKFTQEIMGKVITLRNTDLYNSKCRQVRLYSQKAPIKSGFFYHSIINGTLNFI